MAVKIKRGNDRNLNLTITQNTGTEDEPVWVAKNISGWTITMACKKKENSTTAEFTKTATILSAAGGTATVALTDTDTDMPAGVYYCDVKAVDGSGKKQNSTTFTIEITESIT